MEWGLNLTFRDDIRELLKSDSFHRLVVCCLFVLSVCLFWSIFLREQVNTKKDLQEPDSITAISCRRTILYTV